MTLYECPVCQAAFRDNRGASLLCGRDQWPGLVCPNGHRVTKALKREKRARAVASRARQLGLSEVAYRAGQATEARFARLVARSPLRVSSADLQWANALIGNERAGRPT